MFRYCFLFKKHLGVKNIAFSETVPGYQMYHLKIIQGSLYPLFWGFHPSLFMLWNKNRSFCFCMNRRIFIRLKSLPSLNATASFHVWADTKEKPAIPDSLNRRSQGETMIDNQLDNRIYTKHTPSNRLATHSSVLEIKAKKTFGFSFNRTGSNLPLHLLLSCLLECFSYQWR